MHHNGCKPDIFTGLTPVKEFHAGRGIQHRRPGHWASGASSSRCARRSHRGRTSHRAASRPLTTCLPGEPAILGRIPTLGTPRGAHKGSGISADPTSALLHDLTQVRPPRHARRKLALPVCGRTAWRSAAAATHTHISFALLAEPLAEFNPIGSHGKNK